MRELVWLASKLNQSEEDAGEMVYEFKRATPHAEVPPKDYEISEDAPVALIPQY